MGSGGWVARQRASHLVLLVALSACAGGCAATAPGGEARLPTPAPVVENCGEFPFDQGEGTPPIDIPAAAWACLEAAMAAGTAATVVSSAPTVEGDPIVFTYTVGPLIDGVQLVEDHTADRFGSGDVVRRLCPDTATAADWQARCPEA